MKHDIDLADLELSDAELLELLKSHGLDRRSLMKVLGVGAGITALGGTASGHPGRGTRIDDVWGAPYAADETVPEGLVDHVVELDVLAGPDAVHDGFPVTEDDGELPEFVFGPVGLRVKPGDVVQFENLHHEHTVTAFHEKFGSEQLPITRRSPDGVPGFTSPVIVGGESWLYRFTRTGVYDILCLPHLFYGMVMRIVVAGAGENGDDFDDYGPVPIPNAEEVLGDSKLSPAEIVRRGEVAWEELDI